MRCLYRSSIPSLPRLMLFVYVAQYLRRSADGYLFLYSVRACEACLWCCLGASFVASCSAVGRRSRVAAQAEEAGAR